MATKLKSLNINLPFGLGGATIEINENQQRAAWALYVELATRVAGEELKPGMGSAREALNSLYSLFETTRSVLREAGPGAAQGPDSVGPLAIRILNRGLRPFMVRWHSSLSGFEDAEAVAQRERFGGQTRVVVDESRWPEVDAFYADLEVLRQGLLEYIDALGRIAGIHRDEADSD
jgi:hypothetical protein